MNTSLKVVNLQYEDTGIEGYIQITTQFKDNYFVRYFENLLEYDQYLTISLDNYEIIENNLNIHSCLKNKIVEYVKKNSKPINKFYYHGFTMECSDTLELYSEFQIV